MVVTSNGSYFECEKNAWFFKNVSKIEKEKPFNFLNEFHWQKIGFSIQLNLTNTFSLCLRSLIQF